jgi:methylenetetrahydrofolate--tRNA-(uracil-5-)-methyltransferase
VGLLKEEMRRLGSIIMRAAALSAVPAGKALAVDRELFSETLTNQIQNNPLIQIRREEYTQISEDHRPLIISAGPLATDAITSEITKITGENRLFFYDALAPIVTGESLDLNVLFSANRYMEGEGDYLNAPFTEAEFSDFLNALREADVVTPRAFEDQKYFEGCLPIEVMAERGPKTLLFGPMKPVGLIDPRTQRRAHAVAQLRRENIQGTLWNLVGFQTRLSRSAQEKVFRLIPGLSNCEFARFGAIHRNTYLLAPEVLDEYQRLRRAPHIFLAGQISGVEGYVESAAQGLWAGENASRAFLGLPLVSPPRETALGSLLSHLAPREKHQSTFAPSNINFGLFPNVPEKFPKSQRATFRRQKANEAWATFLSTINYVL